MTGCVTRLSRAGLAICAAAFALVSAHSALALSTGDLAQRKSIAAKGKTLPGTPDLSHLQERLAKRGLPDDAAMFIRIFKAESELEVWINRGGNARYALFATYPICNWSGTLGPKLKEGDRQAPEGFYTVTLPQANPNGPRWPKALDLGFPNSFDMLHARSGSAILIHGGCASIGCFAMTNGVNKELHTLAVRALDAGQSYVPIHVFPFRMTQENLAHYDKPALHAFWNNLKEGYDLFERTRRPPRVSICGGRYDFEGSDPMEGANPGPIAICPTAQTLLKQLAQIKSLKAVETGATTPVKETRLALAGAALWAPAHGYMIERGPNSMAQLAPKYFVPNANPALVRPLLCSLALPSCRKYAALRNKLLQKASAAFGPPPVIEKKRKKRHYTHKRKRRRQSY